MAVAVVIPEQQDPTMRVREEVARHRRAQSTVNEHGGNRPDGDGLQPDEPPPGLELAAPWQQELARALADVERMLGTATTAHRQPLFHDAIELLTREYAGTIWLVGGLITRGGIAQIGAEPKTTKTWLALEIALAVATGTKVCGEFYANAGTAAYFFCEDLEKQVRNRLRALGSGQHRLFAPGRLFVCPRGKFLDITKDDDIAWLVASCRRLGMLDLLVLDPLRDIHSGKENESDDMSNVMRRLRLLGELLGCTVIVVHHAAKSSDTTNSRRPSQRARGSGAIHGSTDSGIYLTNAKADGSDRFTSTVNVEIKGARSAGAFTLELAVQDDVQGEATCAVWTVTRTAATTATGNLEKAAKAEEALFAFVVELAKRGQHLPRSGYRKHKQRPEAVPYGKVFATLDRLIESSRLHVDAAGLVQVSEAPQPDIAGPGAGSLHSRTS